MTLCRWFGRPLTSSAALLVFVLSTQTHAATSLISVDLGGAAAGGAGLNRNPGSPADISPDGRYVLFTSTATDLVPGVSDTNSAADLFLRDRVAGTTAIVSVSATGQALGASALSDFVFSPDSKRLVFGARANNVVSGLTDTNSAPDLFVRDLLTGATSCVTVNAAGTGTGNLGSFTEVSVFSPDGKSLAFVSIAGNLVDGVTDPGGPDMFVRDLETGVTTLVSVRTDGAAGGKSVDEAPRFSPDGRFLAFLDRSADLVANVTDTNDFTDLFVRDLEPGSEAGSTRLVTRGAANQAVISSGYEWTPDGSTIVFSTSGTNVVSGIADTNNGFDVFAWDLATDGIQMLSVNQGGAAAGNARSRFLGVSPDSRFVAFGSDATDLTPVSAGGDGKDDLYLRDLQTGMTTFVARNESASGRFGLTTFSPDGRHLLFETQAADVVAGIADTNGFPDLFTYDLLTGAKTVVTVNAAGTATANSGSTNHDDTVLSPDGRYVSFVSDAGDLVPGFVSASTRDLFVRDLVLGVTSLVSVAPNGGGAGYDQGATRDAEFSPDGKFLLFTDNGLLAPITNPLGFFGAHNLYAFELESRTLRLLSTNAAGTAPGNGGVEPFSFITSPAGGAVLFISTASDMVAGVADTPSTPDAFVATLPGSGATTTTTTTLAGGTSTTQGGPGTTLVPTTTTVPTSTTQPCTTPRCLLDAARTGPDCEGQTIPASVSKQLNRALTLLEQAASSSGNRARKLQKSARAALKRTGKLARKAAKGKRPKLDRGCADALASAAGGIVGGL